MKATRLTLLCQAPTRAVRLGAFPADEPIERATVDISDPVRQALRRADRVWTSPATCARQTAAALDLTAVPDTALADLDCGRWAGCPFETVMTREPEAMAAWMVDPLARPHGGESVAGLADRIAAWLAVRGAEPGHAVAVTHAAVIRAAILHAIGAPLPAFWRLDVTPLSRTLLTRSHGQWRLRALERAGRDL